jgi:hypothetical protein
MAASAFSPQRREKARHTVADDAFTGLRAFQAALGAAQIEVQGFLVYAGEKTQKRTTATVLPWSGINETPWWTRDEWGES